MAKCIFIVGTLNIQELTPLQCARAKFVLRFSLLGRGGVGIGEEWRVTYSKYGHTLVWIRMARGGVQRRVALFSNSLRQTHSLLDRLSRRQRMDQSLQPLAQWNGNR